mgnify:CR=1 FL=1
MFFSLEFIGFFYVALSRETLPLDLHFRNIYYLVNKKEWGEL